ncbi:hypothetical protein Q3G72_029146 [Acer saccharum]|nr:hypothetical protein Q3G72_029146 [Acer saccharum]
MAVSSPLLIQHALFLFLLIYITLCSSPSSFQLRGHEKCLSNSHRNNSSIKGQASQARSEWPVVDDQFSCNDLLLQAFNFVAMKSARQIRIEIILQSKTSWCTSIQQLGVVASRPGDFVAGCGSFKAKTTGKGGHAAIPQDFLSSSFNTCN